jgi:hypothetical protein
MKFCVYTRSFLEDQYLSYFIQHYINLGFDKIIILKSDGIIYNLPENYSSIVEIHYVENKANILLPQYDYLIKKCDCDWCLVIDIDELLILNKSYNNINQYVEEKIKNDELINAFYFRWGMIEKYDIDKNNNFNYILNKYKIFQNQHIKTMFKKKDLIVVAHPHYTELKNLHIYFENNILNQNMPMHVINKNSYKENILIHLHTKSIHNLIIKSVNTKLQKKGITNKNEFINLINTFDSNVNDNDIFNQFAEYIGLKAKLPYSHISSSLIDTSNYDIIKYNYDISDSNMEEINVLNFLHINNIDENKYFNFINKINSKITNDRSFII